jgi:hypothetical protein
VELATGNPNHTNGFFARWNLDPKRTTTPRQGQYNSKDEADAEGIHGRMIPPRSCGDQLAIPRLAIFISLDYDFSLLDA